METAAVGDRSLDFLVAELKPNWEIPSGLWREIARLSGPGHSITLLNLSVGSTRSVEQMLI